jgi:hypothetical protein
MAYKMEVTCSFIIYKSCFGVRLLTYQSYIFEMLFEFNN